MLYNSHQKEKLGVNKMKKTSTVLYTFEDKEGYAETYQKEYFDIIVSSEKIIHKMVAVDLEGENENILVPILNGYKPPYDFAVTDEIGTEHYIYYEELDI